MPTTDSAVVRFFRATGTDHRGRSLDHILGWDDEALESVHDFIQWLFPLAEPSGVNPWAPLVTDADRRAFADDATLRENLRRAFVRMVSFYGFELAGSPETPIVRRSAGWNDRARVWLQPGNHNYLRLTRILKSLTLLGLPQPAAALYDALLEESRRVSPSTIGPVTLEFWRHAARPT